MAETGSSLKPTAPAATEAAPPTSRIVAPSTIWLGLERLLPGKASVASRSAAKFSITA